MQPLINVEKLEEVLFEAELRIDEEAIPVMMSIDGIVMSEDVKSGQHVYYVLTDENECPIALSGFIRTIENIGGMILTESPLSFMNLAKDGIYTFEDTDGLYLDADSRREVASSEDDFDVDGDELYSFLQENDIVPVMQETDDNGNVISERELTVEEFKLLTREDSDVEVE